MSSRYLSILIFITFLSLLSCYALDTEYKWASTIPIQYIPLSSITNEDELNYYLNNGDIVIFYIDDEYDRMRDNWKLYKLNAISIDLDNRSYPRPVDIEKKILEIRPKKVVITYNIDPNSKEMMDIVGYYVSKNNGTFAYINKVPPKYKHVLITGVAVQKTVLDKREDYTIKVAGRKLKVDWRDDKFINKKIKRLKALSKLLNINITYISAGDEILDVIERDDISKYDLKELLNNYWFKKRFKNIYYHTYVSSLHRGYYTKDLDILSMGYYPNIYAHKAPETFKNDPVGGFYPETVSYIGTVKRGYWRKEVTSEDEYYNYIKGEPSDRDCGVSLWYYRGEPVPLEMDSKLNRDRYKHFNHWFVKNYGNVLIKGVDGLLLPSSDKYLLDAVLGRDNREIDWKLNIEGKVEYIVIPGRKELKVEKGIVLFKVPGIFEDLYGVRYIKECYVPPEGENPGVYIEDIVKYNYGALYDWKDNYTWICSFRDYSKWIKPAVKEKKQVVTEDGKYKLIVKLDSNIDLTHITKQYAIFSTKLEYNGNSLKLKLGNGEIVLYRNGVIEVTTKTQKDAIEVTIDVLKVYYRALYCTNCGSCSLWCPLESTRIDSRGIIVNPLNCTGCRMCLEVCPVADVTVEHIVAPLLLDDYRAWKRKTKTRRSVVIGSLKILTTLTQS